MCIIRHMLVILAIFCASGCTALDGLGVIDAVNPMKDDKGIDANLQLGQNNYAVETRGLANVNADTRTATSNNVSANRVEQFTSYKDSTWLIIAFGIMAGIAIPNPLEAWSRRRREKDHKEVVNELRAEVKSLYRELRGVERQGEQTVGQGGLKGEAGENAQGN